MTPLPPVPPYRAVVFDMDGLMLDTEAVFKLAWQAAAKEKGYDMGDELFFQMIGRSRKDSTAILRARFGDSFPMEEFFRYCGEVGRAHIAKVGIPIKKGLIELLDYFRDRNIPLAVATSTWREEAENRLRAAGIFDRFEASVTGDEVTHGKPEPDIYLSAAEKLGVDPRDCLALEDSHPGIRAAHAAGMTALLVPDLIPSNAEIAALAHHVFASLTEVRSWVQAAEKVST